MPQMRSAPERQTIRLTTPDGVSADGNAVVRLPAGLQYHKLHVLYGGTLAHYPEYRLVANTTTVRRMSFAEQDMVNGFDGMAPANGTLTIPLDSIGMRTREGEVETALNVGRPAGADRQPNEITVAELQIEIGAAASAPSIDVYAEVSMARMGGAGLVRHMVKTTRSPAGSGDFDVLDLPYNQPDRAYLRRMFFSTNQIDRQQLFRDNNKIFDRPDALNRKIQADGYRVPDAAWTVMDFSEMGYATGVVSTISAQDFYPRLNMAAAVPGMRIIGEYLGALTQ